MNKYLVKIAEKIELEPGVHWDTSTKQVGFSRDAMNKKMDKKDTQSRRITGGIFGTMGAGLGGLIGLEKMRRTELGPTYRYDIEASNKAFDELRATRPGYPLPDNVKDYYTPSPEYKKRLAQYEVDYAEYSKKFDKLINTEFKKLEPPGYPKLNKLVTTLGGPKRVGFGLGALVGGGIMGGIGYLTGGLNHPIDKQIAKDSIIDKVERDHEAKINSIEGWD